MKKTLIALSVLVAAGSVNAATVYEAEGFSADVFGDLEVGYKQEQGNDVEGRVFVGDQDFGFSATSEVNDDMSIFGTVSFDGEEQGMENTTAQDTGGVNIDNAYIGMTAGAMTVTVGRTVNYTDDLGVANDQQIAGLYTAANATDAKTNQVIKLMYDDGGMFYAGFATTGNNDGTSADTGEISQFDIKAGVRAGDAEIVVIYGDSELLNVDSDILAVQAFYTINGVDLAAQYSAGSTGSVDSTALALSAQYTMDKTTVGAGWSTIDTDGAASTAADMQWYANASYALATNTSVYVEITDTNGDNVDLGYATGIKLSF